MADVTVTIEDDGDVDVDPSSLMFTPQNWNSWKTVTVEAEHDPDTGEDPPVTVTHRASGNSSSEYVGETAVLTVTIEEDDSPGVTVSRRSLTVREGGSNTYTVVLDKQPSTNVTVSVTVPSEADIGVDPTSHEFTPQDWDMPKTFTVTAGRRHHEPGEPIVDADARGQRRRIFRRFCSQCEGHGRG